MAMRFQKPILWVNLGVALTVMAAAEPAAAILGVWRRAAVRTTAVVATTAVARTAVVATAAVATTAVVAGSAAEAESQQQAAAAAAAKSQAAAATAASQQAAAQAAASAQQAKAAAATATAAAPKTPQQKLTELQGLYDQGLISQSDYEAAKTKVLSGVAG
jgi:hypothetical protein